VKHTPRKRFSQNFLIDPQIIAEIIHAIRPSSGDRLIEIGPGLGALTRPLLQIVDHLHAIEIDSVPISPICILCCRKKWSSAW
jgi:16S rRNA (adenine1518-N6/adenine1519-N6)-dimethyltransferase